MITPTGLDALPEDQMPGEVLCGEGGYACGGEGESKRRFYCTQIPVERMRASGMQCWLPSTVLTFRWVTSVRMELEMMQETQERPCSNGFSAFERKQVVMR